MITPQIVVCDGEPHIVRAISLKFTRAGFDVKGAVDVESCWRLLHRGTPPALLIVDQSMTSDSDGLTLVRRIREDLRLMYLPVIMLTAHSIESVHSIESNGPRESFAELKIAQWIVKPFSPRELLTTAMVLLNAESERQGAISVAR